MLDKKLLVASIVAVSTRLVAAGPFDGLNFSTGCKNALNGFFSNTTSGASQCLNTNGLVGILTAGANTSIVNPVSNFVWPFCAADPCSNQTIQDAETNINSNCGSDFNGVVAGTVESGINFLFNTVVLNAYSTVRDVLCLGQASQNCIVETLTNIQNAINEPLSLNNVADLPIKVFEGTANITGNFTTLFCTDCIQAAWVQIKPDFGAVAGGAVDAALEHFCGDAFVNGPLPSNVTEITGTAAAALETGNSKGSTLSISSLGFNLFIAIFGSVFVTMF